jgi:DNA repair exonuclease SbcCD ATPase subunit
MFNQKDNLKIISVTDFCRENLKIIEQLFNEELEKKALEIQLFSRLPEEERNKEVINCLRIINELNEEIIKIKKINKSQLEIEDLVSNNIKYYTVTSIIKKEYEKIKQENERLRNENQKLNSEFSELKNKLNEIVEEIKELKIKDQEIENLQNNLKEEKEKNISLEENKINKLSELKGVKEFLETKVEEIKNDLDSFKSDNESVNKEIDNEIGNYQTQIEVVKKFI